MLKKYTVVRWSRSGEEELKTFVFRRNAIKFIESLGAKYFGDGEWSDGRYYDYIIRRKER